MYPILGEIFKMTRVCMGKGNLSLLRILFCRKSHRFAGFHETKLHHSVSVIAQQLKIGKHFNLLRKKSRATERNQKVESALTNSWIHQPCHIGSGFEETTFMAIFTFYQIGFGSSRKPYTRKTFCLHMERCLQNDFYTLLSRIGNLSKRGRRRQRRRQEKYFFVILVFY